MSDEVKDPQPEEKLTGAEQLELARLRAETAAHQKRTAELEAQNRDLVMHDTVSKSIASSGIKSHLPDRDLYKLISTQEGVTITPSGDGTQLHCERNGEKVEFKQLVEDFAVKNQHMFDGRTLRHLIDNTDAVTSKEDLKTTEDKIRWIAKHGALAYERLGQFRVPSLDASKLTASDWSHMTIAQKTQVIAQHGETIVSKILRRK